MLSFIIKAIAFIVGGKIYNAMQYNDNLQINVSQKPNVSYLIEILM